MLNICFSGWGVYKYWVKNQHWWKMLLWSATMLLVYCRNIFGCVCKKEKKILSFSKTFWKIKYDTKIYLLQNTFSVKSMPIALLIGWLSTNFSSTVFHYCWLLSSVSHHLYPKLYSFFLFNWVFEKLAVWWFWAIQPKTFEIILHHHLVLSQDCLEICTHWRLTKSL